MDASDKINRKLHRCEKRRKRYELKNSIARKYINQGLSFSQAKCYVQYGYFHNNYGERVQICDYRGICSYPCNGDC